MELSTYFRINAQETGQVRGSRCHSVGFLQCCGRAASHYTISWGPYRPLHAAVASRME